MPGNFIQFDQMPMAGRNKSTEKQVEELRNYIKGVMDQLRYELRRIGNTETSGQKSRADAFGYPVGSVYISKGRRTRQRCLAGYGCGCRTGSSWVQAKPMRRGKPEARQHTHW